jgi:metal-responsive CopG/Arc/MetJ family transcriptional regulator
MLVWQYEEKPMPAREITITVPEPLADRFLRVVPSQQRSEWIAEAIERKLRACDDAYDEQPTAACDAFNADPQIAALEREMDTLSGDGLDEHPWHASTPR